MVNVEENFATYLRELEERIALANSKLEQEYNLRRRSYVPQRDQKTAAKIEKIRSSISAMSREAEMLRTDPAIIRTTKLKKAGIKTESFQLPPDFVESDKEYDIWEHAINRRLEGIKKIRVATNPPGAVLVVDGHVCASTPCTISKPLTEASALSGRHKLEVFLEGHKSETTEVDAKPKSDSKNVEIRLKSSDAPNDAADGAVRSFRQMLPDRSVDVEQYDIEYEVVCVGHNLLLGRDELLMVTPDATRCLLNIPYGAINAVSLEKKIMGGIRRMIVSYDEGIFADVRQYFVIDASAYSNSGREVNHRYEVLLDRLEHKRHTSYARMPNPLRRAADYYHITEGDVDDGFRRFDPYSFEVLVARLFDSKGYDARVTQGSGDMGVDVMARNSTEAIAIQVKKWSANVGGPDVHKTLGAMVSQKTTRAIVITTSDFTNQAYEIQRAGSPVELWNGKRLVAELRAHHMVG